MPESGGVSMGVICPYEEQPSWDIRTKSSPRTWSGA